MFQTGNGTENLSEGSQLELDTSHCIGVAPFKSSLDGLLSVSHPRLLVGDFRRLANTSAFRFAKLRGSPHQITLSESCQSLVWCGRRKMNLSVR
jgi:hypothetical protein